MLFHKNLKFALTVLYTGAGKSFFSYISNFIAKKEIYLTFQSILSKIKHIVTFVHYLFNVQKQQ